MFEIKMIDRNIKEVLDQCALSEDKRDGYYQSTNYYDWYYTLSHSLKPTSILEIGTRYGYSLICLLQGYKESTGSFEGFSHVNFMDTEEYTSGSNFLAIRNLTGLYPELEGKIYPSTKSVFDITSEDFVIPEFDLVHLDANHSKLIKDELDKTFPFVKSGGTIIIDDVSSADDMKENLREKQQTAVSWCVERMYDRKIKCYTHINSYRGTMVIIKS